MNKIINFFFFRSFSILDKMSQSKTINTRITDENSIVRSSIPLQVLCHIHRPIVFLVSDIILPS